MFEFEIMVGGYTALVTATSVLISNCVSKKRLKKVKNELMKIKKNVVDLDVEIEKIKHILERSGE